MYLLETHSEFLRRSLLYRAIWRWMETHLGKNFELLGETMSPHCSENLSQNCDQTCTCSIKLTLALPVFTNDVF